MLSIKRLVFQVATWMDVKQNLILTSRVIPMVSVFPLMTDEDMVVYRVSLVIE